MIAVLLTCVAFCKAQLYDAGFPHKNPRKCYCAYLTDLSEVPALEINLTWKRSILPEDRKADVSETPYFPRYQISEPESE